MSPSDLARATVPQAVTAEALAACPTLDAAVAALARAYPFEQHPYFAWAEAASRPAFLGSQLPFRFAVEGFSQALAAVLARVGRVEDRLALSRNVAEEHGHGVLSASHKASFAVYLGALGAEALDGPCPVGVLAFNQALLDLCLARDAAVGAAALGAIEHAYVGVSGAIARLIHARGWVQPGEQSHYEVHERLDVEHARDLLAIAAPPWDAPATRQAVAAGLLLGAHHFWQLYLSLIPHERA